MEASRPARLCRARTMNIQPADSRYDRGTSGAGAKGAAVAKAITLSIGTRLIREWNGKTIAVEVVDGGFLWNDRTWRSLSEIAREVTGAHWSGPRF